MTPLERMARAYLSAGHEDVRKVPPSRLKKVTDWCEFLKREPRWASGECDHAALAVLREEQAPDKESADG